MSPRAIGAVVSFLIVFASGVWLTRAGKPYSGILVNVHKLISLAGVVLLALMARERGQSGSLSPAAIATVVITGLLLLAAIVTGGLASIDKPLPKVVLTAHRVTPFLSVIATAVATYLLIGRS